MGQLRRLAWVSAQAGTRRFLGGFKAGIGAVLIRADGLRMRDGKIKSNIVNY